MGSKQVKITITFEATCTFCSFVCLSVRILLIGFMKWETSQMLEEKYSQTLKDKLPQLKANKKR